MYVTPRACYKQAPVRRLTIAERREVCEMEVKDRRSALFTPKTNKLRKYVILGPA